MTHHCDDPHCHDPHCDGHHHTHEGPEHAGVFAGQRAYTPAAPVSRGALTQAAEAVLLDIGARCCIDGILPGHAKALVEAESGALMLSLTCAGQVDASPSGAWETLGAIPAFTVTLNAHVIGGEPGDEDALFAFFDALCSKRAE